MSADHPTGQVEALLNMIQARLSLPVTLVQTISTRLIQAVAHSCRANPLAPVFARVYTQKPEDQAYHPGVNGWGYFLVERNVNHPGDSEEVAGYLIEIYLYAEGEARWVGV